LLETLWIYFGSSGNSIGRKFWTSEDEEYMSVKQLEYFSLELQSMFAELEKQELEDSAYYPLSP
jgi:DnaK suppressor protein